MILLLRSRKRLRRLWSIH